MSIETNESPTRDSSTRQVAWVVFSALAGAVLVCGAATVELVVILGEELSPRAYVVPFLVGSAGGLAIGALFLALKRRIRNLKIESARSRTAEEALLESDRRYGFLQSEALDSTRVGIFILDADFQIVWFNRAIERYFALRRENEIGGDARRLIRERLCKAFEDPEMFSARVLTSYDHNAHVESFECHMLQSDACEERWLEHWSQPIRSGPHAGGRIEHYYDISERKRAEEERRTAYESLTATLNALPDLLFEVDRQGRIHDFRAPNPDLLYAPPEAFLGKTVSEVLPAEAAKAISTAIAEAAETGLHRGAQYSLEIAGSTRWFELSVAVRTGGTPEARFVTLARDITDRKQADEQKLFLERQVQHTQKLESLGVLAGGIAHDFNNILMPIMGNADLALDQLPPQAPARENIRAIQTASRRAAELAKQMLAYSGRGRFVVEPIDLNQLVNEMSHLLEVSSSKKAVLRYDFADNPPIIEGDATQIRQVIMNLITNASESIGDEPGIVSLSTGRMECSRAYLDGPTGIPRATLDQALPEGRYVYLEVADTGCGMDAETIEKAFDPFFTTKFAGRGLGMAATLGIVHSHKGAIRVQSEVGRGTTFRLLFPATGRAGDRLTVGNEAVVTEKDWRGAGTILLADDEETVRVVCGRMLERMGFSVLTASDGHEALEVFREHADEIVCVILDLTMPRRAGDDCFRDLRRIRDDVRVILTSGYSEQELVQRFAGRGFSAFIQKPYDSAVLMARLREVLE